MIKNASFLSFIFLLATAPGRFSVISLAGHKHVESIQEFLHLINLLTSGMKNSSNPTGEKHIGLDEVCDIFFLDVHLLFFILLTRNDLHHPYRFCDEEAHAPVL